MQNGAFHDLSRHTSQPRLPFFDFLILRSHAPPPTPLYAGLYAARCARRYARFSATAFATPPLDFAVMRRSIASGAERGGSHESRRRRQHERRAAMVPWCEAGGSVCVIFLAVTVQFLPRFTPRSAARARLFACRAVPRTTHAKNFMRQKDNAASAGEYHAAEDRRNDDTGALVQQKCVEAGSGRGQPAAMNTPPRRSDNRPYMYEPPIPAAAEQPNVEPRKIAVTATARRTFLHDFLSRSGRVRGRPAAADSCRPAEGHS